MAMMTLPLQCDIRGRCALATLISSASRLQHTLLGQAAATARGSRTWARPTQVRHAGQ